MNKKKSLTETEITSAESSSAKNLLPENSSTKDSSPANSNHADNNPDVNTTDSTSATGITLQNEISNKSTTKSANKFITKKIPMPDPLLSASQPTSSQNLSNSSATSSNRANSNFYKRIFFRFRPKNSEFTLPNTNLKQPKHPMLNAAEFGKLLKKRRKELNLSIEDVYQELRFRSNFIEALEDGRYYILPDQYFIKGFILQYAEFLNLEPTIYLNYLAQKFHDEYAVQKLKTLDLEQGDNFETNQWNVISRKKPTIHPTRFSQIMTPILAIISLAIIYLGYNFFLSLGAANYTQDLQTATISSDALAIKAEEDVWLKITDANGKVLMESLVPKGQMIKLPTGKEMHLSSSSSAGIRFILNEKIYQYRKADANPLQDIDLSWNKLSNLLLQVNDNISNSTVIDKQQLPITTKPNNIGQ